MGKPLGTKVGLPGAGETGVPAKQYRVSYWSNENVLGS